MWNKKNDYMWNKKNGMINKMELELKLLVELKFQSFHTFTNIFNMVQ